MDEETKFGEVKFGEVKNTIKSGYKTTEFWLSLATGICGLLVTLGVFDAKQATDIATAIGQVAGAVIMAVSTGAYAISRSKSKSENPVNLTPSQE